MGNLWSSAVGAVGAVFPQEEQDGDKQHFKKTELESGEPSSKRAKLTPDIGDAGVDMTALKSWPAANAPYVELKPLTDKDVFITEYISDHKGFSGVIKQRYADFHVTEVMPNGELTPFTTTKPPASDLAALKSRDKTLEYNEDQLSKLEGHIEAQQVNKMLELCKDPGAAFVIVPCSGDRDERTAMHQLIREVFPHLYSRTLTPDVDNEGNQIPPASRPAAAAAEGKGYRLEITRDGSTVSGQRVAPGFRQQPQQGGGQGQGQYCHFSLCKVNMDTNACIRLIARKLRCRPKEISYAGTKDKRAVTTQRMCIRRVRAPRLAGLNRFLRGITLGNFEYRNAFLRLGDHSGNRFEIVLRNCTGSDEQIRQATTSLAEHGFINYYGMQRFGVCAVPTHAVGLAMLKRNFEQAVNLLLPPNSRLMEGMDRACQHYHETGDAHRALVMMPRKCEVERTILRVLERQARDFVTALQTLPRNHRMLYMHAYQSMVWNRAVTERMRRFGLDVLVGDLVYDKDATFDMRQPDQRKKSIIRISAANRHKYSIHDVLMPVPGRDIPYPDNQVYGMYRKILQEDGLNIENLPENIVECILLGDVRQMIALPGHVTWRMVRYDDVKVPLVYSPVEKMEAAASGELLDEGGVPDGQFRALILGLTLDVSCYATMAIREVLKARTDKAFQTSLNVT